jgi:phosphocarrier protein
MPALTRRTAEITNPLGLHLRAADKFARLAQQFRADLLVGLDGREVNGKSILDLTTLAAGPGARLDLRASGPDAEAMLAALSELVEARFYEGDDI